MEIKAWRRLALQCCLFLAVILFIGICRHPTVGRKGQGDIVHAQFQGEAENEETETALEEVNTERVEVVYSRQAYIESISDTYLKIPKASNSTASAVYLENRYLEKTICLSLEGVAKDDYAVEKIERVYKNKSTRGKLSQKNPDKLAERMTTLQHETGDTGKWKVWLTISLRELYEPELYETETSYYITLQHPKEVYDKIVVLDAGHGGNDEGTLTADGKYLEKEYTLRVVQKLRQLLDEAGIKVYCTRLDDRNITKRKRVWLANQTKADMLVSIHCNASEYAASAYGMEGLYSGRKKASSQYLDSRKLSNIILNAVTEHTGRRNRGLRKRNDLYLMNHSKVPVTILEIGYMTNPSDLKYLIRDKNQKEIAQGVFQGIEEALEYIRMKEGLESNE